MAGTRRPNDLRWDNVPLLSVLLLMCGLGLLFAYFKFHGLVEGWPLLERGLLFGAACLMALYGLKNVLAAAWPRPRGRERRGRSREPYAQLSGLGSNRERAAAGGGPHQGEERQAREAGTGPPKQAPAFFVSVLNLLFGLGVGLSLLLIGLACITVGQWFGLIFLLMGCLAGMQVPVSIGWLRGSGSGLETADSRARLFLVPVAGISILLISQRLWRGALVDWGTIVGYAALGSWPLVLVVYAKARRRAEQRQRLRPRPYRALPRPGLVYLLVIMPVMLIGSLLASSNQLMLVFSLMAGAFVINGWYIYTMMTRMRVRRFGSKEVLAGQPFPVDIVVENAKRWFASTMVTATDYVANDTELVKASVLFPRISAGRERTATYRLRLMQRGVYRFGPVRLTTRFPLGLVERGLTFACDDEVLVLPRIGKLTTAWRRHRSQQAELVTRSDPRRGAFQDEFHAIREYRPGDNPRAIHWRTSARQNELMVREFHQTRGQGLVVLLDLWQPPRPTPADRQRVELAVSFAATVCVQHMKETHDALMQLSVAGRETAHWSGRTGTGGAESLLRLLALAEAAADPDAARLLPGPALRRSAGLRTLFLTTREQTDVLHDSSVQDRHGEDGPFRNDIEMMTVDHKTLAPYFLLD